MNPAFQKGMNKVPGSGRKVGSKNKKRLKKVAEVLAENDLNPVKELLNELAQIDEPKDRAKIWLELISFCQAKPKAIEEEDSGDFDEDDFSGVSTEDLLKLVKKPEGA